MLSNYGRQLMAIPLRYMVRLLRPTGITPNGLTLLGLVLTMVTAMFLATGRFVGGGIMLLIASLFDMLDGALARETKQASTFGAFFDSTLDRYAESVTFLALAYYYLTGGAIGINVSGNFTINTPEIFSMLIFLILVGSLMVSYTRARAEALNVECKVGLLQRPERLGLLIFGLMLSGAVPIVWAAILWGMAILTNITALQRIHEVYQQTHTGI
ncbi:MAG: CDP-alcohol phosphatidyltransferase family protein [Chloroflexota bacterium]